MGYDSDSGAIWVVFTDDDTVFTVWGVCATHGEAERFATSIGDRFPEGVKFGPFEVPWRSSSVPLVITSQSTGLPVPHTLPETMTDAGADVLFPPARDADGRRPRHEPPRTVWIVFRDFFFDGELERDIDAVFDARDQAADYITGQQREVAHTAPRYGISSFPVPWRAADETISP